MFSQDAKRNIDACKMCWMCRHLCPVGLVTGNEDNTPRAKAVLLNYVTYDESFLKETGRDLYECALCNHCADWCETGYEPAVYIREGRRALVEADALPANVRPVVENVLEENGTLYGTKIIPAKLTEKLPDTAAVLLYVGDTASAREESMAIAAASLMKKAGVEYTILKQEPSSGAAMYDLVGEIAEVQQTAERLVAAVRVTGAKTVVTLDPSDARIIMQDYPRWGCEIPGLVTATAYFAGLLRDGKLTVKRRQEGCVTFHDPCRLSRDLEETQPAREILAAMGLTLKEMFLHGANTRCCGGEVLSAHSSFITKKTAELRAEDAKRTGAERIITACPGCCDVLNRGETGIPAEDIFTLLGACC